MKKFYLFILFLVLSIAGCNCSGKIEEFTDEQLSVLKTLPENIDFMVYMNYKELKKSDYLKDFSSLSLIKDSSAFFLEGVDDSYKNPINENLNESIIVSSFFSGTSTVYIYQDVAKLNEFLNNKTYCVKNSENGFTWYSRNNRPENKFILVNNALYFSKELDFLKKISDPDGKKLTASPFWESLSKMKYKNHYWLASNSGNLAILLMKIVLGERSNPPGKEIVKMSDKFTLCANFSDNVAVESSLGFKSANYAYLFAGAVNSAISMKIFSKSHPELSEMFDKLDIKRDNKNVWFNIELNKDEVNNIKKILIKKKEKNL